jgi:hypothetical protein
MRAAGAADELVVRLVDGELNVVLAPRAGKKNRHGAMLSAVCDT